MCMYVSISILEHAYIVSTLQLVCQALNMNIWFYPSVLKCTCMLLLVCLSTQAHVSIPGFLSCVCLFLPMYLCFISLSTHANSCFYQFFCLSVHVHVWAKASFNAHLVISRGPYLLLNLHLHLTLCIIGPDN